MKEPIYTVFKLGKIQRWQQVFRLSMREPTQRSRTLFISIYKSRGDIKVFGQRYLSFGKSQFGTVSANLHSRLGSTEKEFLSQNNFQWLLARRWENSAILHLPYKKVSRFSKWIDLWVDTNTKNALFPIRLRKTKRNAIEEERERISRPSYFSCEIRESFSSHS